MRKAIIVLLCVALILPMVFISTPIHAADSYIITIAEDTVLEDVSNNGMAVYIDGIIYIPYTALNNIKGISVTYNVEKQFVAVYRVGAMIHFELALGTTYDYLNNRSINVPAKMREGVPYLPVAVLASWMNMYFSFTPASEVGGSYPVIRICGGTPSTSDSIILHKLSSKISAVARARDKASGLIVSKPPEPLPERTLALMFHCLPTETNQSIINYDIPAILDELANYNLSAGFFFSEEALVPEAECLREIFARGFYPGIVLTDVENPVDQAKRCSDIYAQILHTRVRLVSATTLELTDEQKLSLQEAGFLLWEPDHMPDDGTLTPNKLLSSIRASLKNAEPNSVLQLYPNASALEIIPMLFSYLDAQNFTVAPMTQWTLPF